MLFSVFCLIGFCKLLSTIPKVVDKSIIKNILNFFLSISIITLPKNLSIYFTYICFDLELNLNYKNI